MPREIKEPPPEGCALWVVTFGDAMSLLVAFFVMLVSFADFEEHALDNMMGAMKGGLRAVPLPMATAVARAESRLEEDPAENLTDKDAPSTAETGLERLQDQATRNIIRMNSPDYYLHLLDNGVSLVINLDTMFEYGTATISDPEHEVWGVASHLVRSLDNEIRVAITIPDSIVVRMEGYSTSWGLGIEQSLTIKALLAKSNHGDYGQIGTSVKVAKQMPFGENAGGIAEIHFIGSLDWLMENVPKKIMRGSWRETITYGGRGNDG